MMNLKDKSRKMFWDRIDKKKSKFNQFLPISKYLKENAIETTIGIYCLSGTTYYSNKYQDIQPNSMFLSNNTITITFPCYNNIDTNYIIKAIKGSQ